jgi:hypothetical protein
VALGPALSATVAARHRRSEKKERSTAIWFAPAKIILQVDENENDTSGPKGRLVCAQGWCGGCAQNKCDTSGPKGRLVRAGLAWRLRAK